MTMRTEFETCIQACLQCADACDQCIHGCLAEKVPASMARCIKLDRECAETCRRAAAFLARADEVTEQYARRLCALCAEICEACAAECRQHKMAHCQACADACDACAEACRALIVAPQQA